MVAARVLERAGFTEEEEQAKAGTDAPHRVAGRGLAFTSMRDCIAFAYEHGLASGMGLPTTHDELDALLATAVSEGGGGRDRRSPAPPAGALRVRDEGRAEPISESHAGSLRPAAPQKPRDPLAAQAAFFQQRKRELEAEGWHVGDGGITAEEEARLEAERRAQRERERWERL